ADAGARATGDPGPTGLTAVQRAQSVQELVVIVQQARVSDAPDRQQIEQAATARRTTLEAQAEQLWTQIVAAAPDLRTSQLRDAFAAAHQGLQPSSASPAQLRQFLEDLTAGRIRPAA
ncbi:MAG: hypothetical protein ACRDNL_00705, partial [Spirillospora sp.]